MESAGKSERKAETGNSGFFRIMDSSRQDRRRDGAFRETILRMCRMIWRR